MGSGAFGKVKLVKEVRTDILYALKMVPKRETGSERQKEHVLNERNVMTQLEHPFLVRLQAAFQTKTLFCFVLEVRLLVCVYIFIYKNMCVCVCVCVWFQNQKKNSCFVAVFCWVFVIT